MNSAVSADKKRSSVAEVVERTGNAFGLLKRFSLPVEAEQLDLSTNDSKQPKLMDTVKRSSPTTEVRQDSTKEKRISSGHVEMKASDDPCNGKKRSSVNVDTVQYEVLENDTLTSISARFDMAPSELKQLNKLMSSHVYIGQKLQIYAKNFSEAEERENAQKLIDEERRQSELFEPPRSRHSSAAACDLTRLRNPSGRQDEFHECQSEKSVDRIVRDIKKNRIRLEAKYVTDGQGVVSGTLLITTNTIMFDPNVSDRLVIDRGPNPYVMVAPFDNVARLAIVSDIAAMKWQRSDNVPPPAIYYGSPESDSGAVMPEPQGAPSNSDSAFSSPAKKRESPPATVPSESSLANGEAAFNSRQNSEDTQTAAISSSDKQNNKDLDDGVLCEPATAQLDDVSDNCNATDVCSNRNSKLVLIKNRANLRDAHLEHSPRPGLFSQRCGSHASCGLFPIDDEDQNLESFLPSSLSPVGGFVVGSFAENASSLKGSPIVRTNLPCEIGKAIPSAKRRSFVNVTELASSPVVRKQSFSSMVDGRNVSDAKLVPVYSAKCIPRIASNLQTVGSFDSFCIPPGQNFVVDPSWELFRAGSVDDGFCVSVYDLPPIIDEDARLMEKPDFFISDDEDMVDEDFEVQDPKAGVACSARNSKEIDVEKLLKSTDLYKSLDVLIPRPAAHYEDLPWYLCVVIGCPMPSRNDKAQLSAETYSVENMNPNYWFSIHKRDVNPLYEFIVNHFPKIYGSEDEVNPADRGLVVLIRDLFKSKLEPAVHLPPSSIHCQFYLEEDHVFMPEMSENSRILDDNQIIKLNSELFPRGKDCYWTLVYSMDRDGVSLQTLYRKMSDFADHDPPCIIVIRDSSRMTFGAALSCTIKRSKEYFGNGESFLFSFKDTFKKYSASCINEYYGYGYKDSLCFGAYRGKCGLWIDGDLHHGRTQECATYGNEALTLTEDFYIHQFEAWCLI